MQLTRNVRANEISNWSPFDQLFGLRDELNRLLRADQGTWSPGTEFFNGWVPPLDLYEDKDSCVVMVELPGLKKEEIGIQLHEGALTVSGERKPEKTDSEEPYRSERFFGRFHRSVTLPKPVTADKVTAAYKDGILTVTLPKAEEAKPRQIEVNLG